MRFRENRNKCRCTKKRRWDSDQETCVCRDADRQEYLWDLQRDLKFKILSINDLLNAERVRKLIISPSLYPLLLYPLIITIDKIQI